MAQKKLRCKQLTVSIFTLGEQVLEIEPHILEIVQRDLEKSIQANVSLQYNSELGSLRNHQLISVQIDEV